MYKEGPVGLEHEEPNGLGKPGGQTTGVENLAAGDEEAHGRSTVLSVSDVPGLSQPRRICAVNGATELFSRRRLYAA